MFSSVNDYRSLTSLLENMHHVEYILNDSKVGLSQQDFSKKYLKLVPHADDSQEVKQYLERSKVSTVLEYNIMIFKKTRLDRIERSKVITVSYFRNII